MQEIIKMLDSNAVGIKTKRRIDMMAFIACLTVEVERPTTDYLGKCTGWVRFDGPDGLILYGGKFTGSGDNTIWLDTVQYKTRLQTPYSNYVNPFYLFGILTDEGKKMVFDAYQDEIAHVGKTIEDKVDSAKKKLAEAKQLEDSLNYFKNGVDF